MTRVLLSGGTWDGRVAEIDEGQTVLTAHLQDGDRRWTEQYLGATGQSEVSADGERLPVMYLMSVAEQSPP